MVTFVYIVTFQESQKIDGTFTYYVSSWARQHLGTIKSFQMFADTRVLKKPKQNPQSPNSILPIPPPIVAAIISNI